MSDLIDRHLIAELVDAHGNVHWEDIAGLPSEQPDVPDTNVGDTISRQAAIDALKSQLSDWNDDYNIPVRKSIENIERLPSAQPEIKPIDYQDCANAMLLMWMDKVVTDGEYNRIMDKLNAFWRAKHE